MQNIPTDLALAIVYLLVGIATFLIGMRMMGDGLKKACGGGIKRLFKHTEKNRYLNVAVGAGATAIIQSSDATSIMVIGFLSAGVMSMFQGLCIMLGAYIGTCITGILVSLSSLGNFSQYFVLFALVGAILLFFKNDLVKNIGNVVAGLGLLFFGLATMSFAFKNTTITNGVYQFCESVANIPVSPLLFLLIGILITAVMQSSSAVTGIVIIMVGSKAIQFSSGLYLVLGATVGTVITTLIAAIGGNTSVKRTSWAAFSIRLVCSLIALAIMWPLGDLLANALQNAFGLEFGIALFLIFYNIIFMGILVPPFVKPILNLTSKIIKDKDLEKKRRAIKYIDNHQLATPEIAMLQVKKEIFRMLKLSQVNFERGYNEIIYHNYDETKDLEETEENLDIINMSVSEFLINLSNKVTLSDEKKIGSYFHMINDIERIGDHAYNFHESSNEMKNNDLTFSEAAVVELKDMHDTIMKMFELTKEIVDKEDVKLLPALHEFEDQTDKMKLELSSAHFERITKKQCTPELTGYYSNMVSELERVADHLVNVGYAMVNPTGDDEEHLADKI